MNFNVLSDKDGIHVYVLSQPQTKDREGSKRVAFNGRYLVISDCLTSDETWIEVIETITERGRDEG